MMESQRQIDMKNLPSLVPEKTKKDKLFNDLVAFFDKKCWTWTGGGESHGKHYISRLQSCLWYLDGHHQTLANRSHPLPDIFKKFEGYNTPELSKHRKRSHTNMSIDVLKQHASSLKDSLLSPWMKQQKWQVVKKATQELAECIECYVSDLIEKNKSVKRHHQETMTAQAVATDNLVFKVVDFTNSYPAVLKPLVTVLEGKGNYEYVFVNDFAPVDRREHFTFIRKLEKGIPAKCVLFTKSYGSNIGNYLYIWKVPQHVTLESALTENQRIVSEITTKFPSYHTRSMRREFMSCIGRISPTTKPYVLREIYRQLTSKFVPLNELFANNFTECTNCAFL